MCLALLMIVSVRMKRGSERPEVLLSAECYPLPQQSQPGTQEMVPGQLVGFGRETRREEATPQHSALAER